jgi:signal transduction histidine kinase
LDRIASTARRTARSVATAIVDTDGLQVRAISCAAHDDERIRTSLDMVRAKITELEIIDPVDVTAGDLVATVVPLRTQLAPGALLVSFHDGAVVRVRDVDDRDLLRSFADYAALSLDRGQAMSLREELMLVSDRERIARDLHDVVIQRIFATAMQLQAAARSAAKDDVRDLITRSVAEMDATIRDVRATIFELQAPSAGSLRTELRALVREYERVLGFAPHLRIQGPVETAATEAIRESLLKVLRGALSNVARHSEATTVEILIAVTAGRFALTVDDNGVGFGRPGTGSGLENARARADQLGGELRLDTGDLGGARLAWSVPLSVR